MNVHFNIDEKHLYIFSLKGYIDVLSYIYLIGTFFL